MDVTPIQKEFLDLHNAEPESNVAIIAMKVLYNLIKRSTATTILGLTSSVNEAKADMQKLAVSRTSVQSGCELFYRFITYTALDQEVCLCLFRCKFFKMSSL